MATVFTNGGRPSRPLQVWIWVLCELWSKLLKGGYIGDGRYRVLIIGVTKGDAGIGFGLFTFRGVWGGGGFGAV